MCRVDYRGIQLFCSTVGNVMFVVLYVPQTSSRQLLQQDGIYFGFRLPSALFLTPSAPKEQVV